MAMAIANARLSPTPIYSTHSSCSSLHRSPFSSSQNHVHLKSFRSFPPVRALDLDPNTIIAVGVGVASIGLGIAIPMFYETQIDSAATRENNQPCFPCKGSGAQTCRFCMGNGEVRVELGAGETEVSKCVNCEGAGSLTCTTCQGSGIQPRYLDRREFKDDD